MRLLSTALLAGLMMTSAISLSHAADQNFKIVNKTGYQIDSIYVSKHSSDDWGNDIMGPNAVPDGSVVNVTFPNKTSGCSFDLKVEYDDGTKAVWEKLDLCTISKVTIHYNAKTDTTSAETE